MTTTTISTAYVVRSRFKLEAVSADTFHRTRKDAREYARNQRAKGFRTSLYIYQKTTRLTPTT